MTEKVRAEIVSLADALPISELSRCLDDGQIAARTLETVQRTTDDADGHHAGVTLREANNLVADALDGLSEAWQFLYAGHL